jgi:hypothetical protein
MSVSSYYSLIIKWSSKVSLNVISPISFKQRIITCGIRRVGDIN